MRDKGKGLISLSADEHDRLLALTAEKSWKDFVNKIEELAKVFDDDFKTAELSAESLLYSRGKVDGASEMLALIIDFKEYIRYEEPDDED